MKMLIPLVNWILLPLSVLQVVQSNFTCPSINIRKEIRQLAPKDLDEVFRVIEILRNNGEYDNMMDLFYKNVQERALSPSLFPWQRIFLKKLELGMQRISPNITLPYWDWSLEVKIPDRSTMLRLFQKKSNPVCIGTSSERSPLVSRKSPCLDLKVQDPIRFFSPEFLVFFLGKYPTFEEFHKRLELLNAKIHMELQNMAGNRIQLRDPINLFQAAFMDKLYATWQELHPKAVYNETNSKVETKVTPQASQSALVSLDSKATNTADLCFEYSKVNHSLSKSRIKLMKDSFGSPKY
ncbi:hypothetical protein K7432_002257 [Basidiobolus ranarum]|uniref:Tyrosinase copper-binding domain-containing protein n=1 Tax=Basidiobolus ranarum TaxID=34480 RepID=A0ABR2W902_9FUNG